MYNSCGELIRNVLDSDPWLSPDHMVNGVINRPHLNRELLIEAVQSEEKSPVDLMNQFNQSHYMAQPFQDPVEFLRFNNAGAHFRIDESKILKQRGRIALIIEKPPP